MMDLKINQIKEWVKARDKRERILLVVVGCAILYFFCYFFITRPIQLSQKELRNQITTLNNNVQTTRQEAATILSIVKEYSLIKKLEANKALSNQSDDLQKLLENSAKQVSINGSIENVLKDILKQPGQNIQLVDIRHLANEPLISSGTEIKNLPLSIKRISKHGMYIEIQSDYIGTVDYLTTLEKLSWNLYWDSLNYRVLQYPKANVIIKLYVLVNNLDDKI